MGNYTILGECPYLIFEACFLPGRDTFRNLAKLRLQELIFCENAQIDALSPNLSVSIAIVLIFLSKNAVFRNLPYKRPPGPIFVQNERRDALSPNLILSWPVSALPASF